MPVNAEKKQERGKFPKGQSGNPKGKIRGTKNKVTLAAELLLKGELDNICRRLIEEALKGNMQAIKLILDRIMPPRKDRSLEIKIPKLNSSDDALNAISVIANAVASGNISPCEGESISRIIDMYVKTVNTCDIENVLRSWRLSLFMSRSISNRLKKLEDKFKCNPASWIALVIYNPKSCLKADIPPIKANVILYLPDNGHRIPYDKPMPSVGYLIKHL